jgi:hypothetical protein
MSERAEPFDTRADAVAQMAFMPNLLPPDLLKVARQAARGRRTAGRLCRPLHVP